MWESNKMFKEKYESHFVPYLMNCHYSDSHNWMYEERLSWMAATIYQNIKPKLGYVII
jgi:hypothetical protein